MLPNVILPDSSASQVFCFNISVEIHIQRFEKILPTTALIKFVIKSQVY